MPIYEYVCGGCQREYKVRKTRDDARKKAPCPECGGEGKRRLSLKR